VLGEIARWLDDRVCHLERARISWGEVRGSTVLPVSDLPSSIHLSSHWHPHLFLDTPIARFLDREADSQTQGWCICCTRAGTSVISPGGVRGLVSLDPPPSVRLATTILSYAFALPCIPRIQYLSSVSHLSNHSHALSGLRSSPTLIYPHSIRLNCAPGILLVHSFVPYASFWTDRTEIRRSSKRDFHTASDVGEGNFASHHPRLITRAGVAGND
jgi:hypothetical protein